MGIRIAWRAVLALACVALFAEPAAADPPSFTGEEILASGPSTLVNLRGQGAIAGTAPVNVQVNAVRVGGILSPLISIVRRVLEPGATEGIFAETAGGVTIGVLRKLVKQGVIKKSDVTVAYITGNGLKTQEAVVDAVGRPVRIQPSLVSFQKTFKMGKHGGGDA